MIPDQLIHLHPISEQRGGYKPISMVGDGEEMYLELHYLFGYEVILLHPMRCTFFPLFQGFYSLTNSLCLHTFGVEAMVAQYMHDWHSPHQILILDYLNSCWTAQYFRHLFECTDIKLREFFCLFPPTNFSETFSSPTPLLQCLSRWLLLNPSRCAAFRMQTWVIPAFPNQFPMWVAPAQSTMTCSLSCANFHALIHQWLECPDILHYTSKPCWINNTQHGPCRNSILSGSKQQQSTKPTHIGIHIQPIWLNVPPSLPIRL
jgi:hypothetical protein